MDEFQTFAILDINLAFLIVAYFQLMLRTVSFRLVISSDVLYNQETKQQKDRI